MAYIMSASSPVGSEIFAGIALLILSLVVLLILRYYLPLRTTPLYLLVPVFFGLWLPAGIILLVPIDLASNAATDDEAARGIWFPPRLLLVSWRITYWLTFALTWFILPLLAEYSDAGYREPKDRVLYSLRSNIQYYMILFGTGIAGLAYVFVSYGVSFVSLKGLVMALAYCWGLVLAIYLMGHGLVSIPRTLFRNASLTGRLRRLQTHAPMIHEKMEDAMMNLEELEAQVSELSKRKTGSARDFQDWIEELADMCSIPESRPASILPPPTSESRVIPTVITQKYLADLTRQLVRARYARVRYMDEWNRLLQDAGRTQAIIDSGGSKRLDFGRPTPDASFFERISILTPHTRYFVHFHIVPALRMILGGFLAAASACIVWSEMVKVVLPDASVIRLSVVHHWTGDKGQVGFAGQVIAALWILYMCAAALVSVTEVKVWRGRALVRRNTAHESAFWYAGQVARLSVPLSYNFMTFLSPKIYKQTTFYDFLGQLIDLTPLGKWFDYLFPVFILIPVLATLFGLYSKVKHFFGFDVYLADDDDNEDEPSYGTGSWREGRDLIDRELHGTSISARTHGDTSGRTAPILSVPRSQGPRTPFSTSPPYHDNPRRLGRAQNYTAEEDTEDDNVFSSLGHRFRNTIDTMNTPKWLQDIKKPKWMGGGGSNDGGGSSSRPPPAGRSNSDVRRWFGGEGRVRL